MVILHLSIQCFKNLNFYHSNNLSGTKYFILDFRSYNFIYFYELRKNVNFKHLKRL